MLLYCEHNRLVPLLSLLSTNIPSWSWVWPVNSITNADKTTSRKHYFKTLGIASIDTDKWTMWSKTVVLVAWPSGLRRWFKAPVISMAWVRIPPLPKHANFLWKLGKEICLFFHQFSLKYDNQSLCLKIWQQLLWCKLFFMKLCNY